MSFQKWGYRANGDARIFTLEDGETLPVGWSDTPEVIEDESARTAEALSIRLREPSQREPATSAQAEFTEASLPVNGAIGNEAISEKDTLMSEARDLGITVDGRWGIERLRAEIAAARG